MRLLLAEVGGGGLQDWDIIDYSEGYLFVFFHSPLQGQVNQG